MGKAAIYNPYLNTLGGGERYTLSIAKVLSEELGMDVDFEWGEKSIKEKNELSNKISELQNKINSTPSIERYEDAIKKLEEENKKLISFSNQYINVFKNTLKALQGNLDNAIELQDILVNDVKGR